MSKAVLFLGDGMADEPLAELDNKTPLEYANTPNMDKIASAGVSGTFLSLPEEFPTSSDVANMSVLGYDLEKYYPGRGSIEAVSQGIDLKEDEIAFRCNFINRREDKLIDYAAGHVKNEIAAQLIKDLQENFGSEKVRFCHGVSFRNLVILKGKEFASKINFHKPDSSQGKFLKDIQPSAPNNDPKAENTVNFIKDITEKTFKFLSEHPLNRDLEVPANSIWLHSPGVKPNLPSFSEVYSGSKGAIISAVDVIKGLGYCTNMEVVEVEGATGFIDTNYEGKANAAIEAMKNNDFVYIHLEATDECSHMGRLDLKLEGIEKFDSKIVGPVLKALESEGISFGVLPDHPVPIRLLKHTRTPVPFALCGPHIKPDSIKSYDENQAAGGSVGQLKKDELMKKLMNLENK